MCAQGRRQGAAPLLRLSQKAAPPFTTKSCGPLPHPSGTRSGREVFFARHMSWQKMIMRLFDSMRRQGRQTSVCRLDFLCAESSKSLTNPKICGTFDLRPMRGSDEMAAFTVLFATRFVKQLVMIPVHIVVIIFVERVLRVPFDKYIRAEND